MIIGNIFKGNLITLKSAKEPNATAEVRLFFIPKVQFIKLMLKIPIKIPKDTKVTVKGVVFQINAFTAEVIEYLNIEASSLALASLIFSLYLNLN